MIRHKRLLAPFLLLECLFLMASCCFMPLKTSNQVAAISSRGNTGQGKVIIAEKLGGGYKNLCGDASGVGIDPTTQELAGCNDKKKTGGVVAAVMRIAYIILGIVAVIFLIYGGFLYIYSAGDPGKIKKAKDTIMYAILGIVVAVLAAALINFVIISVRGGA